MLTENNHVCANASLDKRHDIIAIINLSRLPKLVFFPNIKSCIYEHGKLYTTGMYLIKDVRLSHWPFDVESDDNNLCIFRVVDD